MTRMSRRGWLAPCHAPIPYFVPTLVWLTLAELESWESSIVMPTTMSESRHPSQSSIFSTVTKPSKITMDTKALLHDESQDEIYYDEVPVSDDGLPTEGMEKLVSKKPSFRRFLKPVVLYGFVTLLYSLILVAAVLKMQSLRLQGPGLIYCKLLFVHSKSPAD